MRFLSYHEKRTRGTFDFPIELYHVDSAHPRYEMPFHWHMDTELLLVSEGEFHLLLDGEELHLCAGESTYIPAGAVHGGSPQNCVYECIVFDAERFFQDSSICRQRFHQAFNTQEWPVCYFSQKSGIGRLVGELFCAMRQEYRGYEFITVGLLWQLMGLLIGHREHDTDEEIIRHRTNRTEQFKDVLRLIRSDYNKNLTLDMLADEAGMSPRYFCRAFRSVTGRTPVDYVNYYRVERAAELLRSTSESVTEIAMSCGFSDSGYFSRMFRKYKDCSPSQFRSQAYQRSVLHTLK